LEIIKTLYSFANIKLFQMLLTININKLSLILQRKSAAAPVCNRRPVAPVCDRRASVVALMPHFQTPLPLPRLSRRTFQNESRGRGFLVEGFEMSAATDFLTNQTSFIKSAASDLMNQVSFVKAESVFLINQGEGGLAAASSLIFGGSFAIAAAADLTIINLCRLRLVTASLNHSDLTKYLIF
jgi:hypothetical protein